ncbi:MAG: putative PEP-binding protein, partial [Pseudomonadota bacterium]
VAKALDLPAIGNVPRLIERLNSGDPAIVDGAAGDIHLRPSADIEASYVDKVRFLARRQKQFRSLRNKAAITQDGVHVELQLNAGLSIDMPHLEASGASGIGLFRTELQFMIASTFPRVTKQTATYREILAAAGDKPVTFRALDIGGDKVLPYMRQPKEDNPALGWRAVRLALDRPGLFRMQVRALLRASVGRDLRLMIPMITDISEFRRARALIDRERAVAVKRGQPVPERVLVGAMIEVPAILYSLDALLHEVDFVSVGSNDLLQYLFAADRTNPLVATRYDPLHVASLRVLKHIAETCVAKNVPVTLCGEMGGNTIEAMALLGVGFRTISMAPASVGPVKSMCLSVDVSRVRDEIDRALLSNETGSLRDRLRRFAETDSVEI